MLKTGARISTVSHRIGFQSGRALQAPAIRRLLRGSALVTTLCLAAGPAFAAGGKGGDTRGGAGGVSNATSAGGAGAGHISSGGGGGGGGGAGTTGGAGGVGNNGSGAAGTGGSSAGAAGNAGSTSSVGAGGGGGGAHGFVGAAFTGTPANGGAGGAGGGGGINVGGGGGGGAGGYGDVVTGTGALGTLSINTLGGDGGAGGATTGAAGFGGNGGDGGYGLLFTNAAGATFTIGAGTLVQGGAGGAAGVATSNAARNGTAGVDGAGISGQNLTITLANGATVAGGGTTGSAIVFTGGTNALTFLGATSGLTGGIVTTGTLTFNQATAVTVANAISGAGAVVKSGAGTLTWSGPNTNTGATTISAGTLRAGAANAFSASSTVNVTGGTLDLNGFNQTLGALAVSAGQTVSLGSATLTAGANNASTTIAGSVTGSGGFSKVGTGTQTISGALGYTGTTRVEAGTLTIGVGGSIASTSITLAGGALRLNAANAVVPGAALNQTTGQLALGASQEFGALSGSGGSGIIFGAGTTLTVGRNNSSDTYSGVIGTDGNGALTKTGTGTLTLGGVNLYTGATTVSGGTLQAGVANAFGNGSAVTLAGSALDLNGFNQAIGSLTGNAGSSVSLGSGTLTAGSNNASTTYAGTINGAGGFTKTGSGTTTLAGTNTYAGATIVSGGTLRAGSTSAFGTGAVNLTAGTLDLNGNDQTIGSLAGSAGTTVSLGAATLNAGSDNTSTSYAGIITGTGGLTKAGTGTMTLSGANTYTGATTISGGALTNAGSLTSAVINGSTFNSSGTLTGALGNSGSANISAGALNGAVSNNSGGTLNITGAVGTAANNIVTNAAGGIALVGATGNYTVGGTGSTTIASIANGGAMTIANGGALTLTDGFMTNSGTLAVNGTLALSNTALSLGNSGTTTIAGTLGSGVRISDGSVFVTGAGSIARDVNFVSGTNAGMFDISGATSGVALSGLTSDAGTSGTVKLGAKTLTLANTVTNDFTGTIQGTGGLDKTGAGTTTLIGTNTYSGVTNVSAGTLRAGAVNAFGTGSAVTLNSGTLDLNGFNQTIGSLAGDAGSTVNLTATLTTGADNTSTTFAGGIAGTGNLTKAGTGAMTLSGTNTYSGATTISAGALTNSGSLSSAVTNSAGATFNNSGTVSNTVTNYGTANISGGALNGAVSNNSGGVFNVTGTATSNSTFSNAAGATTTIAATGNYQATNTFTNNGTVTVDDGGTLSVTGGGRAFIHAAGTTTINGTLDVTDLRVSDGTVFLNRSMPGMVSFSPGGAGASLLDLSNATSGVTTSGLRSIGAGTGMVNLGANTLTISNSLGSQSFVGTIQGTGGITVGPNGYLSFGPGSIGAYTGATTASGGSLYIRSQDAIAASSLLNVTSTAAYVSVASDANIRSLQGIAGSSVNLAGNLTLTNASTVFAGIIADGGTVNSSYGVTLAGGHQTLGGNSTYTNTTTVNGGTLSVNGSIATSSMTTVNVGGTLGGTGTVGNTTINGGALAPGNSIGTLSVQGNLVFTAASSYMVEVSPTSADRVNVSGSAILGGATVNASFASAPGAYVSKQYTILNATGGRTGTFGALVNTNLPANFSSALGYDANNAYLNLTLNYVPPAPDPTPVPTPLPGYNALTGNQQRVADTLVSYFNRSGGIPLVFGALNAAGLTQVSGETATGSQQTTFDAMNQFMGILSDPAIDGRGSNANAAAIPFADETMAYAARRRPGDALAAIYRKAPPMAPGFMPSWSVWAAGFGGSQTTDGNASVGSNTATSRVYGTAVGADYRLSHDTIVGFALAGGGTRFSVANAGTGRSDLLQAGAFIRHAVGPAYLSAALAYGWQDVTTERAVGLDRLQARFSANAFSGRIESGYRVATASMGVTPYAAAQVTTFELPGYGETAAAGTTVFALNYGARTVTASRSELGLRTERSFAVSDAILTLRGRAAWAHDFNTDRAATATFQTLPGASFVVNGATLARDAALTTASAEMKWTNGWAVAATFEGEFSEVTRSYAGKGIVRYAW